jgi:hypothetical protein
MNISLRARLASYINDRTKEWNQASIDHKKAHPRCAFCNRKDKIEAHDKLPYHLLSEAQTHDYAWLRKNLISACRRTGDVWGCHFSTCHCNDPKFLQYNPDVDKIAAEMQKHWNKCQS